MKKMIMIICVCLLLGASANAKPIKFDGTGHWYEIISAPNMNWITALDEAGKLGGYLATITSEEENNFIFLNLGISKKPYWLGGLQLLNASEPSGGWQWVNGDDWDWTNWNLEDGQPDDSNGGEDALAFDSRKADGTWNDAPIWSGYENGGYVVEYEQSPVPEPATMLLFGLGLLGLAGVSRKKK